MNPDKSPKSFTWKYPATLRNVGRICSSAAQVLDKQAFSKKDRFAIELLLRESLNNAVIHGCHKNRLLCISCHLIISAQEVILEVADEGPGFPHENVYPSLPDAADESGRGLIIYSLYANSISFNEARNCVTLTRILNQGEKDD